MNKFNDTAAQRQYFQKLKLALDVRSFPPTFQDSKTFNNLDYHDYRNQAETMLYSNATRMLQLRSEELDRVKDIESFPFNTYGSTHDLQIASPSLPAPPPPPPHKQEHLNEANTKVSKIIRSYAQDSSAHHGNRSRSMKTADEIEAERIKSYNEGANIFKINRIREFTPDFEKQYANSFANNNNNNNGKPELTRQRSSLDMIAADKIKQKNEAVNAGCYVPNLPQTTGNS